MSKPYSKEMKIIRAQVEASASQGVEAIAPLSCKQAIDLLDILDELHEEIETLEADLELAHQSFEDSHEDS